MKTGGETLVTAIYTDIGRGHPNYLDSVLRYIRSNHPEQYQKIRIISVFDISRGLSLWGWKAVRRMYRAGSRGGIISNLYNRFRSAQSQYNQDSILIRVLRRDLVTYLKDYQGICLVAHPLLARMLHNQHRVFYLHGEVAAPKESAVGEVEKVYVPIPETGEKMVPMGVSPETIVETGLVLEPELCANLDGVIEQRIQRIKSEGQPLTAGFFISGAYPKHHVDLIVEGAKSCYRARLPVRLCWGCDAEEVRRLIYALREFSTEIACDDGSGSKISDKPIVIVTGKSREAATIRSMLYLPDLDLFCAAPHERINWAAGAGLPIILITPAIGTFAPENRDFVLKIGCGIEMSSINLFLGLGSELTRIQQNGQLLQMIEAGRRIKEIHGAKTIAEDIIACIKDT